jgi:transposase InsO family protein
VADSLFNGHRIQALTVIDNLSRGCLAITVDRNLRGDDVVDAMEHIKSMRGAPKRIQIDNVLHAESRFVRRHKDAFAATGPQICGALADTDGFRLFGVCSRP